MSKHVGMKNSIRFHYMKSKLFLDPFWSILWRKYLDKSRLKFDLDSYWAEFRVSLCGWCLWVHTCGRGEAFMSGIWMPYDWIYCFEIFKIEKVSTVELNFLNCNFEYFLSSFRIKSFHNKNFPPTGVHLNSKRENFFVNILWVELHSTQISWKSLKAQTLSIRRIATKSFSFSNFTWNYRWISQWLKEEWN